MAPPPSRATFCFDDWVLDGHAYQLRRGSRRIRLERRPMELLFLLVERSGELVSRADIASRLWGDGVFVDVEAGVNTAVRKVRRALRDAPDRPTYLETVPGKGYRFIARVTPGGRAGPTTLAVLPVANLTGDPWREYLADGLTEELIAALGQVGGAELRIVGRTSTLRFKGATSALADIGQALDADYLVEGSVRGEGDWLRITARLVRIRDQAQVWCGSYDRQPHDLLRLQSELCAAIAEEIRVTLSPDRLVRLERRQTRSAEAYDLYLRGRGAWHQLTPATTQQAIACFAQATERDTDYALAWSGIADALAAGPVTGDVRPADVAGRAVAAAGEAMRAQGDLAEAQASAGPVRFWLQWEWPAAEAAFRRAIALDPHYPFAVRMLGHVLSQTGRHDAARLAMTRARELDPYFAMHHALSAQIAFQADASEDALVHARQAITVDPRFWVGHFELGQAVERLGDPAAALDALAQAAALSGGNSKVVALAGYVEARCGRTDAARARLAGLDTAARTRYVPPCAQALVHLGLGEIDAAFDRLDAAADVRDVHLVYLPVDPKWLPVRADARFGALLGRCGFGPSPAPSRIP
jgi:TolB-like protein/Flp pilus assembly protein TadD